MMKISSTFLMILMVGFSAVACTSTGENPGNEKSSPAAEISNPAGNPDGDQAKPEFLNKETFKQKIWNYEENPKEWVYEGDQPAIIDFYADWCKPCKMVAPILEEISRDYQGEIKVYKIDTQVERELAAVFQVTSIPTFLYIPENGKPQMDRGFKDKAAFERIIKDILLK